VVEDQNHLESYCREYCTASTIGRHETDEQAAENSNDDRLFWVFLSRIWTAWRKSLVIVTPDIVVRWHRKGFNFSGNSNPKVREDLTSIVISASLSEKWPKPIRA